MEKVTEERLVKAGWDEKRTIDISNIKDVYQKLGLVMPMNVEKFLTVYGMLVFEDDERKENLEFIPEKALGCNLDKVYFEELLEEYDINEVVRKVKEGYESGAKTHHVIVVAEGVMGAEEFAAKMKEAGDTSDLRATNIGHVVRGGSPTARDRVLASWMGAHAVDLLKQGIGGVAVGIHNEELVESPILGTAEEGALFSLTEDGKIIVNNPHKARLDFADLNSSLSNLS